MIIVVLMLVAISHCQLKLQLFNESEVDQYNARCLDGSPAGFYYQSASDSSNSKNWVIHLEGGGYCLPDNLADNKANVDPCSNRVLNALGSSKYFPATAAPSIFSDWNQVFLPYCTGDLHAGIMTEASSGFYFSGHLILAAVLSKLNKEYNLQEATGVVLIGESAGAIGVFINSEYVKEQLPENVMYVGVANAGWFLPLPPFNPKFQGLDNLAQIFESFCDMYVNPLCASSFPSSPINCLWANYTFPYISSPIFIAQSIFDQNNLEAQLGTLPLSYGNRTSDNFVLEVSQIVNNSISSYIRDSDGGLITSDYVHVLGPNDGADGQTAIQVLLNWFSQKSPSTVFSSCTTPNCQPFP